ncbi:MAG: hypothetical protein ACAH88_09885 [Roseimicrobium sp.]
MKRKPPFRKQLAIAFLGVLCLSTLLQADMRHFTDKDGRTIKAEFVSVKGDFVTLKREDGKEFTVRVDTFAKVDIDYIREQAVKTGLPVTGALTPPPLDRLVVEVLIDGPSELRVKKDGVYWINGPNSKPGRHAKRNLPTYLNGGGWQPVWQEPDKERGRDTSSTAAVPGLDPKTFKFTLISVGQTREAAGIEERDKIEVSTKDGELAIRIPDSQGGSRWYKFELSKLKE